MIDYSKVKKVRVPKWFSSTPCAMTVGKEYAFVQTVLCFGVILNDQGGMSNVCLPECAILWGQAWEVLNPDTNTWEVAT